MNKKVLVVALGPALFFVCLTVLGFTSLSADAAIVLSLAIWMLTWWVSETVPLAVTALLPIFLFPLFGILTVKEATRSYGDPVIFLFMGGFILALALEKHKLHERIALNLIRLTGSSGNGIILGFTLATAFLSMWISNTATAIMMLPIAMSVVNLMKDEFAKNEANEKKFLNFSTALMLAIAYASSIGGMATLIGSPPNTVMAGLYRAQYQVDFTFLEWFKFGFPLALLVLAACYVLLTRFLYPNHLPKVAGSEKLINQQLAALGPMRFAEWGVLAVFVFTSLLWICRPWVNEALVFLLFEEGAKLILLDDTSIAILGAVLMFIVPADDQGKEFLLDWTDSKRMAWGILLLFGGGLCLAQALENTGLIQLIGTSIAAQGQWSLFMLILIVTFLAIFLTEFMSNVALTTVFVPIGFGIANAMDVPPLLLAMPITFGASCAFAMPISTPPNAVLYSSGYVKMWQMIRAGVWLNVLSLGIIVAVAMTVGRSLFEP
ncbi:MAG: DASS family sodium-coupled anion symporter [Cyclobacteriaceae bacterium]|jgi:sodium-dependent dicarboxylate transporter 2/3/5|nr:DASS family sodium-coupled anion symporter [Cyclobacteriaceae bacterium]